MNRNKKQMGLINNNVKNDSHEEIFENLVKERFYEIIDLTNKANFDDLIYYFKGDSSRNNDFKNRIKLFKKMKSGEKKIKLAKKLRSLFKSNLNETVRGKYKSKQQESAL